MIWYVGFCAIIGTPQLVQRVLKPGFAHCWGAKRIDDDLWYWVEWTPERLILGLASDLLVQRASAAATEVWCITQPDDAPGARRPVLALQHCASIVSHAVGLRPKPWATPWSLRCALKGAGALCVIPRSAEADPTQERSDEKPEGTNPLTSGA